MLLGLSVRDHLYEDHTHMPVVLHVQQYTLHTMAHSIVRALCELSITFVLNVYCYGNQSETMRLYGYLEHHCLRALYMYMYVLS